MVIVVVVVVGVGVGGWLVLVGVGWLVVVGCGWLWLVVVGCGWLWLVVVGCGCFRRFLDDCVWPHDIGVPMSPRTNLHVAEHLGVGLRASPSSSRAPQKVR